MSTVTRLVRGAIRVALLSREERRRRTRFLTTTSGPRVARTANIPISRCGPRGRDGPVMATGIFRPTYRKLRMQEPRGRLVVGFEIDHRQNTDRHVRLIATIVLAHVGACGRASVDRCAQDRASSAWLAARRRARPNSRARRIRPGDRHRDGAYYLQRPLDPCGSQRSRSSADGARAHYLIGSAELDLGELASAERHLLIADAGRGHGTRTPRHRPQSALGGRIQQGNYREALLAEEAARDRRCEFMTIAWSSRRHRARPSCEDRRRHGAELAIEQAIAELGAPEDRVYALLNAASSTSTRETRRRARGR